MALQLLGFGGRTPATAAAVAAGASVAFPVPKSHSAPSKSTPADGPCVVASGAPGPSSAALPAAVLAAAVLAASALALPISPSPRSYQLFRCLLVIVGQSEGLTGGLAPHASAIAAAPGQSSTAPPAAVAAASSPPEPLPRSPKTYTASALYSAPTFFSPVH